MAYRAPVQPGFEETKLQTTAAPVDTYVRPAESPAQQLVKALSEVDPTVQQFTQDWASRTEAEQKQAGIEQARRLAAHVQAQGDAVRSGDLPMQDSAWFQAGLQEESGRISAGNFNSYFTANVAPKLDGAMSLADFDNAWAQSQAEWQKSGGNTDEFFQKGQSGYMEQYRQEQRLRFAQDLEGKFGQKATEVIHSRVMQIVDDDRRNGVYVEKTGENIEHFIQSQVTLGVPEKIARLAAAQAGIDYAKQQPDPEQGRWALNDFFHSVKGLGGGTLAEDATAGELFQKADKELRNESWDIERHDREAKEYAAKESEQSDMDKLGQQFQKTPLGVSQKWIQENIAPANWGKAQTYAAALKQANVTRFTPDNPIAFLKLGARALSGDLDTAGVVAAMNENRISEEQGVQLHSLIASTARGGAWEQLQKLPNYRDMFNDIHGHYTSPFGGFASQQDADLASVAESNFNIRALAAMNDGTIGKLMMDPSDPNHEKVAKFFGDLRNSVVSQDFGGLSADFNARMAKMSKLKTSGPIDPNKPDLGTYNLGMPTAASESATPEEQKKAATSTAKVVNTSTIILKPEEIQGAWSRNPADYEKAKAEARRLGLPTDPQSMLNFLSPLIKNLAAEQAKNRTK